MKVVNKIFIPLMRSPLHFLVSHSLLLTTVTRRKTGKQYTTTVANVRDEQRVVFVSGPYMLWNKNLEGGPPLPRRCPPDFLLDIL